MISVVIPAHNEQHVIGRLLRGLLHSADPEEFEVYVVCNGCTDDTATVAARFGPAVNVVETPVASKAAALNLGDRLATAFPRFFIDADVEMYTEDLRRVAAEFGNPEVLAAAPMIRFDLDDVSFLVRLHHRFWQSMPYFDGSLIGSGVYAVSQEGRRRFDRFPELIADDQFVKEQFAPHERRSVEGSKYTKHPPRSLRSLLRTRSRVFAGRLELRLRTDGVGSLVSTPHSEGGAPRKSRMRSVVANPRLWPAGLVYTMVYIAAWARAYVKVCYGDLRVWERDETARAGE